MDVDQIIRNLTSIELVSSAWSKTAKAAREYIECKEADRRFREKLADQVVGHEFHLGDD